MELAKHHMIFEGESREFVMLPSGALWNVSTHILYLADLHLGKGEHFSSHGISVPLQVDKGCLEKLNNDLLLTQPRQVYFLGDLFHSTYNSAVEQLGSVLANYCNTSFHLIPGNHDILQEDKYKGLSLQVESRLLIKEGLLLVHDALDLVGQQSNNYFVAGHIHPGVLMKGKGRQKMCLPCFYWGKKGVYLPAYGLFTGIKVLKPIKGERVYVLAGGKVLEVKA
jgi:DNA ligase-associated metallophosphoesterase